MPQRKGRSLKSQFKIDRLPEEFLKDSVYLIPEPVTDVCHLLVFLNKSHASFKLAKARLLSQKVRKMNVSNYRAFSSLPLNSKDFEKVVHNQTTKFLIYNFVLHKYHSGSRSNYSADIFLKFLKLNCKRLSVSEIS